MEIDIEKLETDYFNIAIDASYIKNLEKHILTIEDNIKQLGYTFQCPIS